MISEFSHEDDNDKLWRDESESKLVCDFNSIKFGRIISESNTVIRFVKLLLTIKIDQKSSGQNTRR